MSTTPESGPGGLTHNHIWNTDLNINNRGAMPRVRIDPPEGKITGLFDLPDFSDNREKRTAAIGEAIYPNLPSGKTVVYTGVMEAENEEDLQVLRQFMRDQFAAGMGSERLMQIVPDVGFGDDIWSYLSKLLPGGFSADEEITRKKTSTITTFARRFQVSLRMSDPRFLLTSAYVETEMTDANDPLILPNYGAPADPIFTVNLPTSGSMVDLVSNTVVTPSGPARLRFGGIVGDPMPGGGGLQLFVDFREGGKTARFSDGANAMHWFDSAYSNWWDELIPGFQPGDNEVTTSGGGQWKVEYWPRCY